MTDLHDAFEAVLRDQGLLPEGPHVNADLLAALKAAVARPSIALLNADTPWLAQARAAIAKAEESR